MPSILNATTTTGLVSSADNSGSLQLQTNNGTTALTIDTSQNVGIGTSSPSEKLSVTGNVTATGTNTSATYFHRSIAPATESNIETSLITTGNGANQRAGLFATNDYNNTLATELIFKTNATTGGATERMRITSGGNVTISTGTLGFTNQNGVTTPTANGQGSIGTYNVYGTTITGQGSSYDISFFNKNQGVAGYVATGATTITTSSDERLKENLVPITNALATVNNLRTVTGNYKADPSRNVAFFIAQDMKEHFPQAFEDANPDAFGVNYNWTIPLLAAAIKELKAELDATKAEVQALKGVA